MKILVICIAIAYLHLIYLQLQNVNFVHSQYILPSIHSIVSFACISQIQDKNLLLIMVLFVVFFQIINMMFNYVRFSDEVELFIAKE